MAEVAAFSEVVDNIDVVVVINDVVVINVVIVVNFVFEVLDDIVVVVVDVCVSFRIVLALPSFEVDFSFFRLIVSSVLLSEKSSCLIFTEAVGT